MKISAQEEYGLRCLLRVARSTGESLTLPEIASAEGLSVPYVAKLMAVMRQAGLVESVRGRAGGYKLARTPEDIGLGSLLLTLGEPLFDETDYCQKHAGIAPNGICVNKSSCSLKTLWHTLESWVRGTLDRITLADLIRHEGRLAEFLRERLAVGDGVPHVIPLTMLSE
jgi:Rrf2 family protein